MLNSQLIEGFVPDKQFTLLTSLMILLERMGKVYGHPNSKLMVIVEFAKNSGV